MNGYVVRKVLEMMCVIYEDYNYNKNEDLGCCALCHKAFKEAEPVSTLNLPKGPFVLAHKECYKKLIHDVEDSETETGYVSNNVLNLEDKLWRYMDLAKFISMLKSSTLYFSSPKYFEDIFEGAYGLLKNRQAWDDFYLSYARTAIITAPDNCWHKIEKKKLEENAKSIVEQISCSRQGIFINCWHHSEFESEAMWKIYATNVKNAIAIQTTYRELKQQVGERVTIKPVRYVDYSNQFIGPNEEYWCKRKSFEYEKEVRAVIHDFDSAKQTGIPVKVNLNEMIKNIYVSPYAPDWFREIVVDVVERYGYMFKVSMSSMAELPF